MKIEMTVGMYVGLRGVPGDVDGDRPALNKFNRVVGLYMRELHVARHGAPSDIMVDLGHGQKVKAYGERDHDLLDLAYDLAVIAWRELVEKDDF